MTGAQNPPQSAVFNQGTSLAVFDLGKTNSKMLVFAADGELLAERRTKPTWVDRGGKRVLDQVTLFNWMHEALAETVRPFGISGVTFSCHGCTFALIDGNDLAFPILDYEQEIPEELSTEFAALVPPFAQTYSPRLPLGFNVARHVFWLMKTETCAVAAANWLLMYPQFWTWRFSGSAFAEYSYLGAHTHFWEPLARQYSTVVSALGLSSKMAPLLPAGAEAGTYDLALPDGTCRSLTIYNGVHDSNAALAYYRATGIDDFTLVSTGTWVIVMNLTCPLDALIEQRDMLCNVTVKGEPAPSIRFMGGREYDLISKGWNWPISQAAIDRVIAGNTFAAPSFCAGGPFSETSGEIIGPAVAGEDLAALAALYIVMMTDLSLDLIRSANTIILDGGLTRIDLFAPMLGQLRGQTVRCSSMTEGTATGAAAIVFDRLGHRPFRDETTAVKPSCIPGLEAYRERWREIVDNRRAAAIRAAQTGESVHG